MSLRTIPGPPLAVHDGAEIVSAAAIRRFVEAFELSCPVYTDDAAARSAGHDGVVAPAAMVIAMALPPYWSPGDPPATMDALAPPYRWDCVDLPGTEMMSTRVSLEFDRALRPGDRIRSEYRVARVTPKTTSVGTGSFVDYEVSLLSQSLELIAVLRTSIYRYAPHAEPQEPKASRPFPAIDQGRSPVAQFEFPLSMQRLIMCSVAAGDFATTHLVDGDAIAAGAPGAYADMHCCLALLERAAMLSTGDDAVIRLLGPLELGGFLVAGTPVSVRAYRCEEPQVGSGLEVVEVVLSQSERARPVVGRATVRRL